MRDFTKEINLLRQFRKDPDKDDVLYKEKVKQKLLDNNELIYLLNNKELEDSEAENDEYFGINILPCYIISPTQSSAKNYVCYETSVENISRDNSIIKYQELIFYILCHVSDNIVKEIGSARHDLIASVLIDAFQGSNLFGNQMKLISNKPSITDNDYVSRTLIFSQWTTNYPVRNGKVTNLRSGNR